jgi:hypothetical protein
VKSSTETIAVRNPDTTNSTITVHDINDPTEIHTEEESSDSDATTYSWAGKLTPKAKPPKIIRRIRVLVRQIDGTMPNSKQMEQPSLRDQHEHLKNKRQSSKNRHEKGQTAKRRAKSKPYAQAMLRSLLETAKVDGLERGDFASEVKYARMLVGLITNA